MSRTKIVVVLVLAVLAVGLGYRLLLYTPKEFRQVDVASYESDATELLVRELLQQGGTNNASAYFLAFGHRLTPPTDTFLRRFSGHQPPVKSYAASGASPTGDVIDASSGKVGVMIQIAKIERKSDDEIDVEVALSNLPVGSNRFMYTVVQRDGRWQVKGRKPYG